MHCQEVTTAPTIPEKQTVSPTNTLNSTGVTNDALSDENPAWEPPEVLPDSVSGVGVPGHPKTKHNLKPLAVHFTQKFSDWSRPIYEKFCKIKGLLSHNDHPNYGGVLGPQQIWEKWQEKGHHFLTGRNFI